MKSTIAIEYYYFDLDKDYYDNILNQVSILIAKHSTAIPFCDFLLEFFANYYLYVVKSWFMPTQIALQIIKINVNMRGKITEGI